MSFKLFSSKKGFGFSSTFYGFKNNWAAQLTYFQSAFVVHTATKSDFLFSSDMNSQKFFMFTVFKDSFTLFNYLLAFTKRRLFR